MRNLFCFLCLTLMFLFVSSASIFSKSLSVINRIEGQVYDQNRVPVENANVELLNEVDSLLSRTRTNSAGRFSFLGVSGGRFRIRVLPLGKNLIEQTQEVEVNNQLSRSDTVFVDFYLRPYRRASSTLPERPAEAIFVQEVPLEAQKLYESGVSKLENNQDKGLLEIEEAIKIFPNYFNALSRLGKEYILRKDYQKAYPYLLKALDINPRSSSGYYSLSYAFYQLNEIPAALKAAELGVNVNASSVDAQLLYGTLLRVSGNYKEAERTLVKAKTLAKKPYAEIHWQLALLFNKLKRNKEAAEELEAYLKILPDSPDKNKIKDLISKLRTSKQT